MKGRLLTTAAVVIVATQVHAATVNWATWNYPQTPGLANGVATGSTSDTSLIYVGNVFFGSQSVGFTWTPGTSFSGGTVSDSPTNNTEVALIGGPGTSTSAILFSQPVINPVLAIADLGQLPTVDSSGITASFVFSTDQFSIEAGGPNDGNGGSSIFLCAGDFGVCGNDGSGVVQFFGTYISLSWTNPTFDNYSLFTVGTEGLENIGGVPEPSTWVMFWLGFGVLGFAATRKHSKQFKLVKLNLMGSLRAT